MLPLYPDLKKTAYRAFHRALRRQELRPPHACERCGTETTRLDGHHADYRAPLTVQWLCRSCHQQIHSEREWEVQPLKRWWS